MNPDYRTILDTLDVAALPEEDQQALLEDLHELVFKGSLVRMIEQMDDATKEAFEALMTSDAAEEQIEAFLKERVPGADQAVEDTVRELAGDILSGTGTNQE
ncbi:MAG TPA: DUF5663 domain-containing protein [Candidatus Paceibacterota bacterium]